jgi:hypothetical protein
MVAEGMESKSPRIKIGRGGPIIASSSRKYEVFAVIALCAGLAIVWIAFELGQTRAGHNRREAQEDHDGLESQLQTATNENTVLREKIAVLETDARIDSEAYRQVEAQLAGLQAQILKQQEDLAFYRGIVADQGSGVRIQDLELLGGVDQFSYSLRLVLAQEMRATRRISGYVEVNIEGIRDGEPLTLSLRELAAAGGGNSRLNFSFRYFQNLQANLVLPEGFAPARVKVKLMQNGGSAKPVEKSFDWGAQVG